MPKPKLTTAERISLKDHPEISETDIQQYIFENPSVLGIGDISPIRREKVQPSGGRLDMLLGDDDTRYEVEIQLGATDPSHIIRTIEYWDMEKRRYPKYNHVAVIVAEDITNRFLNVISLFNGAIPLIALQMCATKLGDEICLSFVKVLDKTDLGTDDENEVEQTDRKYWSKRTDVLPIMDRIFEDVVTFAPGFDLKYNKFYIGVTQNGSAVNFITFRPKRHFLTMKIFLPETEENTEKLENTTLQADYIGREKAYRVKFFSKEEYAEHRDLLKELILSAMKNRNVI